MKRVAIIGSRGTGKSTFARKLAYKTGLPLVHLDFYYHNTTKNYYTNKEAWRRKADELALSESWIIDGNFSSTLENRIERADTVFYFDMPTYIAIVGIIKRWFGACRTKRLDMPDDWQEKSTREFFWYVFWFRRHYAVSTAELLKKASSTTVITFRNHRDVSDYMKTLT